MIIEAYILDLRKRGITHTSKIDVKNVIVDYLKENNMHYTCNLDDNFQYTIQLI